MFQFVQRVLIMFMPPKYQPDYMYLRHVPLRRVHLFTTIQIVCLIGLWVIKTIKQISIIFPLMVCIINCHYCCVDAGACQPTLCHAFFCREYFSVHLWRKSRELLRITSMFNFEIFILCTLCSLMKGCSVVCTVLCSRELRWDGDDGNPTDSTEMEA